VAGNSMESGRSVTSKVVAILMTFADGEVRTLTEVARLAGIPTSTVHRLIGELTSWGVLERTEGSQYRVGVPLKEICRHGTRVPNLHERARRVMEDLSVVAHTPVRLGVLVDSRVCYIEKTSVNRPVSSYSDGCTAPVHATSMGKALLAFSPPMTVETVVARGLKAFTAHTLTSVEDLRKALSAIRLSRVAVSRWEWVSGVSTVAVPVFGGGGKVVAALELTVRDLRTDLRTLHPVLIVAARSLSRELASSHVYDRSPLTHRDWGTPPMAPMVSAHAESDRRQTAGL
jgi:IclR family acetate operon transcriptional repressor